MSSPHVWSAGFNFTGTVFENGPAILQRAPSYLSGSVQFLDTIGGNDANAGSNPSKPVKTLAQAVTNSAANGLIVIGEGSTETLSGSQTLSLAGLWIVGCGSGSTRPRYTCSGVVVLFNITAAGVVINNLFFPASTAAATARIDMTSTSGQVVDCYFECGASDTNRTVRVPAGGSNATITGTSFVSTASQPAIGLEITGAATDVTVKNCTFDGGSFGWSDAAFKIDGAALRINGDNNTMLNQADFNISVTATSYKLFGLTTGGTSKTDITA